MGLKRILIDMDDVLADASAAILAEFNKLNNQNLTQDFFTDHDFYTYVKNEKFISYRPILYKKGFFSNLSVIADSQKVVEKLCKAHEVFIVSAAMEFPNSLEEKFYWLEKHFPFIKWQNIILCGDKTPIVGDYLIDDHEKNLRNFGGTPLLFEAVHNFNVTGYSRMKSWAEIDAYFFG